MHLFLAAIFAAVPIVEDWIIPVFRKHPSPSAMRRLLDRHYDTCLWTSLTVALTVCLAGSVQRLSNSLTRPYDGFAVLQAVNSTYWSFLLVCASHSRQKNRPALFVFALFTTSVFAVTPFIIISSNTNGDNVLRACQLLADINTTNSTALAKEAAIHPIDADEKIFKGVTFGFALILLAAWLLLMHHQDVPRFSGWRSRVSLPYDSTTMSVHMSTNGNNS